ncbi:acyl-CoA dehydrogenase family protein [Agrobacterium tumefaciens]|uniref:Acyl-CoA/acyl-ACP dehydrogenase n=1 Tax=Agrobacterium tumefaciens TaxID=358 RepID=A0AA44J959_AGRTU|nr:acyl-CoA dehydrogenase family protein [Agrobacterium tumefaciens]NSL21321.1 acyl-CoA/acyl-ACP dehydrogenase [Agrobacterium tumefaciens]NTB83893.1 acyl-CoA/acyl-ACP dehydrogenase [Agrobacterium tumefaciens]NTC20638.1 acyl-CoA/acyl-ACP dehydrogenase [Agrobacterium tumefaciens]NTC29364.1 acyl-CoA/acyl-ACP dehydrogenase [Agrobacterium tumefaciens]NTC57860.1 acyl-CoA/acyl-ACP dehydrogenase [Agrobacterium tumefaciens]
MTKHTPSTPLLLDDDLLSTLREEFAQTAADHDRDASFPFNNFKRLGEHRLIALTVPREYGGLGAGIVDATRLVSAVGAGEASTGLLVAMNCLMHHLLGKNQPRNYAEIAAAAVEGTGVLNALQAEPDLGSAVRGGLPGTAIQRREDGGWSLNGRKAWATGSPIVRWWLTLARTDEEHPRVGTVIVPSNSPGLTVIPTWNHAGLRATNSHEIQFKGVELPEYADAGFLPVGSPELIARRAVVDVWSCILTAALYDGVARAGRDWIRKFLNERVPANLGAPLATVPRLQGVVGEIESLLLINRSIIDEAAYSADVAQTPDPLRAQLVKHIVTNNAVRALELALSISGNHGLDRANPLERHYRDALCGRVHAPQSDTILTNAGRAALSA